MNKCIVIGGGFAGLTTAAYLSNKNIKVDLFEAAPKLGGRAYSFLAKDGNTVIDNGQHILMGCYNETLRFMKMIGASNNLIYQSSLEINFLEENFRQLKLKATSFPYPFNLMFGILNYRALRLSQRFKVLQFFIKVFTYSDKELKKLSVYDWLSKEKQNGAISKSLWEIISIGALNTSIKKASAQIFADILKEIFLKGTFASTIIIPRYGLSETYCHNAKSFIEKNEGRVFLSKPVTDLIIRNNRIVEVKTDDQSITEFDCVISAVPLYSLQKFTSVFYLSKKPELRYSSILSVHLWLSHNPLKESFYGLINSPVHWIFNKKNHLTIVISDADYLNDKTKEEIIFLVAKELKKYINLELDDIIDFQVIKEKRATFIPSENILHSRPSVVTGLDNFFVAGDWIDTGLPSTIESAVKSGRMAADAVLHARTCKFNFYNEKRKNNAGKG